MWHGLYIEQETLPLAEAGKEVMFVFRDPTFSGAAPVIYVSPVASAASVELRSGEGSHTDSYSEISAVANIPLGETRRFTVPVSGALTQPVTCVRVISGSATISIVSPTPVTAEFRTRKHP